MDALKIMLLLVAVSLGSGGIPTTAAESEHHTSHHADEPVTIHIFKQYGGKIIT